MINDDSKIAFELSLLLPTSKEIFFLFKKTLKKEKLTTCCILMVDPRFKSLCLVSSFVDREEGVSIVNEYDRRTLYLMLLKRYHHLHPMTKIVGCENQIGDEDSNLDIFQQIGSPSEPSKELVTKELLIFKHYQVDPKDIQCPLQWWRNHETMFPTIGFLAHQMLSIVGSQIET